MMKQFVKDYLQFTKRDRIGVLVLVTLIFVVILLPYIWPVRKPPVLSPQEVAKIKAQLASVQTNAVASPARPAEKMAAYSGSAPKSYHIGNDKLFYFDPNTLDILGWQQLGVREKTAATIVKYVSRGGKFRRPEDISKIYGLSEKDYVRLMPFVRINPPAAIKEVTLQKTAINSEKSAYPQRKFSPIIAIDINIADTAAFIALPGIGSKLATRIVAFREKLGGFYSVKQISDTYGLPDSTFIKIEPFLQCGRPFIRQIDINSADVNTLKQHPYIRWALANAIIQYRAQHGNFKSVDDLQQIALITPEIFEKLKPYLVTGQ